MWHVYLKLGILSALASSLWNTINDCDESFNYLEPLYFISSNESAFQTWEYSPEYALRSYLYLWTFGWPACLLKVFGLPAWFKFLCIRLQLSLLYAFASCLLAHFCSKRLFPNEPAERASFGIIFCVLGLASPGAFISMSSAVPSAYGASMTSLMLAFWINGDLFFAVGTVAFSALLLWPFTACLGIPLAIFFLVKDPKRFFAYTIFWAAIIIPPIVVVDSYYYGKFVFPTWNIISYNALSAIGGRSLSQLYGTEPLMYYVKNYLLNYNIAFVVAVVILPMFITICLLQSVFRTLSTPVKNLIDVALMAFSPFLLWNVVFFLQSHKEERFLFPCFPCLSIMSALVFCPLLRIPRQKTSFKAFPPILLIVAFVVTFILISLSRILAITSGYSAPMFLVTHLPPPQTPATLCIGRDWHYFPSQFLLPDGNEKWNVAFLKSAFKGQLPGKFAEGVGIISATRTAINKFNDMNREESDRFIDLEQCNFILDRISPPGKNEVQYSADIKKWKVLLERQILDRPADKTNYGDDGLRKLLSTLKRAFYIPFLFTKDNKWITMHILKKI
uniref:Mannosyltransferase n=1 Tax=Schistocephalus solidus TaxID=70667 RepID=A0A0X3PD78_SCHSO